MNKSSEDIKKHWILHDEVYYLLFQKQRLIAFPKVKAFLPRLKVAKSALSRMRYRACLINSVDALSTENLSAAED